MVDQSRRTVEVVLDIFSGRENPHWSISGERLEDLYQKLENLPEGEPKSPPGLGYRGFLLLNVPRANTNADLRVFESVIGITQKGETRHYVDAHELEDWLINQARQLGHSDALDHFRAPNRR